MSSIQMNVTKADIWWVNCQLCKFETKPTPDWDAAENARVEHYAHHRRPEADPSRLEPGERDTILADLGDLLIALDMGDYARPDSPHEVMRACIRKAAALSKLDNDLRLMLEGK